MLARLYPELHPAGSDMVLSRNVTFQVTDACNLACTYCYQVCKGHRSMRFEHARKLIDMLLEGDPKLSGYVTLENSPGIVLEFIGGEPFLEVGLIDRICSYFMDRAIELRHPWAERSCFSICSNGVLVKTPEVQAFLRKWAHHLSFSVTIDGNRDLHDSCRVFPDGSPSYDLAVAAAKDWMDRGGKMGSKVTIAPANLPYLFDAITHMVRLGYDDINANTVFEEGWRPEHAREFYRQLKRLADWWNDDGMVETHYLSLFQQDIGKPKEPGDDDNWCGGTGKMLAMDPDGYLFPCIRYMESSLGDEREPMVIGHVDTGIAQCEGCRKCVGMLNAITRRTQSTDECYYCPIADGCAWCSAYNYQVTGTPDKRCTFICDMHKARSLANAYFWNRYYRENDVLDTDGRPRRFEVHCPDEWALEIIDVDELAMLKELAE